MNATFAKALIFLLKRHDCRHDELDERDQLLADLDPIANSAAEPAKAKGKKDQDAA